MKCFGREFKIGFCMSWHGLSRLFGNRIDLFKMFERSFELHSLYQEPIALSFND